MTPWTVFHQTPLSMGFSRQEYQGMLLFSPPRDLPNQGIKPKALAPPVLAGDSLPLSRLGNIGKPLNLTELVDASVKWQ